MVGNEVGLAAVVFDWAGTVVDFGSLAPMGAFVELFASEGVHITIEDARVPMGLPKWQHIQALGRLPRVAAAWQARHGGALTDADVDRLYERFTPMNMAAVPRHATLVEGVPALVQALRTRGLKIGSTTGYNREIMAVLAPLAAEQGFEPDNLVCAGDVSQNRPAPLGMYRTFIDLGVWPARRVVKVDDTVPGLMEGRAAGCWTVAITDSGNETGVSAADWQAMPQAEQEDRRRGAMRRLAAASPDYTIRTVADLLPVLDAIERRLVAGESPH
ncbi:phosphonoacetaldehyde hydrolase [Rubrivivax albus]|uniref:Phosphonoacetaldehyde hydrolase n=1 Tax=Rubrivivax albus TaxID=2499835 RepID=A0A3S2TMT2_9BURK|nr:phosphonoacetaldehyde hydrolase [Rubrivivax albus]RVT51548.1 phosphonoacetaldehyde hydrolase [Rubrivivax albus]